MSSEEVHDDEVIAPIEGAGTSGLRTNPNDDESPMDEDQLKPKEDQTTTATTTATATSTTTTTTTTATTTTATAAFLATSQGKLNVSPGKKNKRKMAEPRRRITDFSIRNICSESTSCSSFASEIEVDGFTEKKLKTEENGRERSDSVHPSDVTPFKEFQSLRDVAPLDVLVSLSLLTQQHNRRLHLDASTTRFADAPNASKARAPKQHRRKPPTRVVSTPAEGRREANEASSIEDTKMTSDQVLLEAKIESIDGRAVMDFSTEVKGKHEKSAHEEEEEEEEEEEVAEEAEGREEDGVEVLSVGCKVERNLESSSSAMDETGREDATFESSDTKSTLKKSTSQLHPHRKGGFSEAAISGRNSHDGSPNGSGGGVGLQPRKNYKNMTKQRRIEANARERTRVHTISAAFESLRKAVPSYSHNQRLSKLAILRIACSYILALVKLSELESDEETEANSSRSSMADAMTFSQCVDLCTQTIQSEGKTKRRH